MGERREENLGREEFMHFESITSFVCVTRFENKQRIKKLLV